MPSYVCEFNLNVAGEKADGFLQRAARDWPPLWGRIPGVRGTLLLQNAFGLGGDFSYVFRVDIDSVSTLQAIDEALKSDDRDWKKIRGDYFQHRTQVRSRLVQFSAGDEAYLKSGSGTEGLIHVVVSHGGGDAARDIAGGLKDYKGVHAVQHLAALIQPAGGSEGGETWIRLANLASLGDALGRLPGGRATTQLFGEIREVQGNLLVGA